MRASMQELLGSDLVIKVESNEGHYDSCEAVLPVCYACSVL